MNPNGSWIGEAIVAKLGFRLWPQSASALIAVVSCTMLVGCATDPAPETASTDEQDLIGGTKASKDPAVVAVVLQGGGKLSTCTGTLVSPHVVLTAAHCVAPQDVGTGKAMWVFTGNNTESPWPWLWKSVAEVHVHPGYKPPTGGYDTDIAVVITSSVMPMAPLPMNRKPLAPSDVGRTVRIVGFGRTKFDDPNSVGKKNQTNLKITSVQSALFTTFSATSNTCGGDSGGPVLIQNNGKEYIAGVHVRGSKNCDGGGTSMRVDVNTSNFIDPFIAKFDPQFKPPQ